MSWFGAGEDCGCDCDCPCIECENGEVRRIIAYTFDISGVPSSPTNWHYYDGGEQPYYYKTTINGMDAFNGVKTFSLDSDCNLYVYDGDPVTITYTWEKWSVPWGVIMDPEVKRDCPYELVDSGSGEATLYFGCGVESYSRPHDYRQIVATAFLPVDDGVTLGVSYGAGTSLSYDPYTGEPYGTTDPCAVTPVSGSMTNGRLSTYECDQAYSYPFSGTVTPTMEEEGCRDCRDEVATVTFNIPDIPAELVVWQKSGMVWLKYTFRGLDALNGSNIFDAGLLVSPSFELMPDIQGSYKVETYKTLDDPVTFYGCPDLDEGPLEEGTYEPLAYRVRGDANNWHTLHVTTYNGVFGMSFVPDHFNPCGTSPISAAYNGRYEIAYPSGLCYSLAEYITGTAVSGTL